MVRELISAFILSALVNIISPSSVFAQDLLPVGLGQTRLLQFSDQALSNAGTPTTERLSVHPDDAQAEIEAVRVYRLHGILDPIITFGIVNPETFERSDDQNAEAALRLCQRLAAVGAELYHRYYPSISHPILGIGLYGESEKPGVSRNRFGGAFRLSPDGCQPAKFARTAPIFHTDNSSANFVEMPDKTRITVDRLTWMTGTHGRTSAIILRDPEQHESKRSTIAHLLCRYVFLTNKYHNQIDSIMIDFMAEKHGAGSVEFESGEMFVYELSKGSCSSVRTAQRMGAVPR